MQADLTNKTSFAGRLHVPSVEPMRWIALIVFGLLFSTQLAAQPFASAGPESAMIVGSPGLEAQDLYRVQFIEINGRNIAGERDVIWLEPGRYTLTVRMLIDNPPGLRSRRPNRRDDSGYNRIEIVAEAGKRYHVLAKYDDTRQGAPYRTVLYKVEDTTD